MPRRNSSPRSKRRTARRRDAAFWRATVSEWAQSGETRAEFCAGRDLNPSTLSWWKWRIASGDVPEVVDPSPAAEEPRFLPVQIVSHPAVELATGGIEILLGDRLLVRVTGDFDPIVLAKVISTLEQLA